MRKRKCLVTFGTLCIIQYNMMKMMIEECTVWSIKSFLENRDNFSKLDEYMIMHEFSTTKYRDFKRENLSSSQVKSLGTCIYC